MRTALYPGTFDPVTLGHLDVIGRCARLYDRVVVGVAINRDKGPLFDLEERVAMLEAACVDISRATGAEIRAHPFETLLVDCAREVGASVIVRGLRQVADYEYEAQMAHMNRRLDEGIETVFLIARPEHQAVASRLVKEIARLGGDVSPFVPSAVRDALTERMGQNRG